MASVKKEFGPSAVYGKSNRAAGLLCKHFLALVHSVVEEAKVPGVEFAGDEFCEVADCIETSPNAPTTTPETRPELYEFLVLFPLPPFFVFFRFSIRINIGPSYKFHAPEPEGTNLTSGEGNKRPHNTLDFSNSNSN